MVDQRPASPPGPRNALTGRPAAASLPTSMSADPLMSRLVARPGLWLTLVALIASYPIVRAVRADLPAKLPILGELPAFSLTDQHGRTFGTEQLAGKVWIANFIFTRCPTVCPVFTRTLAGVQDRMRHVAPAIRLVSFSVDPDHDTPEVLAEYARKHRASPRMWTFLTGAPEDIRRTVRDGLKVALEDQGMVGDVPDILHGTHFVLVDQRSRIRGYYASDDPERVGQMVQDLEMLVNRGD